MKAIAVAMILVASSGQPFVIDGDTLAFGHERVRIANLDAPEVGRNARCRLEQRRGEAALAYARELIRGSSSVEVVDVQRIDRFGRIVASVLVDDRDFVFGAVDLQTGALNSN
jgi:endonuclease YncB( thermonuclease family)